MNSFNRLGAPTVDDAATMSIEEQEVPQVFSASGRIGRLRFFVYTGLSFLVFCLVAGIGSALGIVGDPGIFAMFVAYAVFL